LFFKRANEEEGLQTLLFPPKREGRRRERRLRLSDEGKEEIISSSKRGLKRGEGVFHKTLISWEKERGEAVAQKAKVWRKGEGVRKRTP